ncbi:MAG: Hsp20/alpha crystallin family protein [bacterium]
MPYGPARQGGRWTGPQSALPVLREEIDRMSKMLDEFFGNMEMAPMPIWGPPIDVSEVDDKVIVKAELPGIDPGQLDISAVEDMLTLKGEKKEEKNEKEHYYSSERRYGEFSRSVRLPSRIDKDSIEARFHNGVLMIEMKKMPEARKKIEVKVL